MALSSVVSKIFNVEICRTLETLIMGRSRFRNRHQSIRTYDFLLTFHSNHGSISYRFRDRRRFPSKIAKISHPLVLCIPAEGVPLGIGYRRLESKKLEWWGYWAEKKVWRYL